jgi:16S rRNA (cytosine967-C5)-methyltransferase
LLARDSRIARSRITAEDVFGREEFVTIDGDLRTLPLQLPDPDARWSGLDGFYAARLIRKPA